VTAAATGRDRISVRLPIFAAPMFLVSGPALVQAACRAGIIGAFPSHNARTPADLERWMIEIRDDLAAASASRIAGVGAAPHPVATHPIAPWCVNLVTHSTNARLKDDLALVARYQPPIVVTALGGPRPVMDVVRGYGGIVIADVVTMPLARKAIAAGVDGLACVCAGAGGHTGFLSPFAFISAVRAQFDGLIVVGGGIADGRAVAGAIAAGADYVYMGTRFIPATESIAVPAYKQMVVDSTLDDLVVSAGITGTPAIWLKPSLLAAGLDPDHMPDQPARGYDASNEGPARWKDLWAAGQGIDSSRAIEPVAAIVDQLEHEYRDALASLAARTGPRS
jgi:nitronate monooxygenase